MHTKTILPTIAAIGISLVSADSVCSQSTVTLNSASDASQLSSCTTVSGSIIISSSATGEITIDGPSSIGGNLTVSDNGAITSLKSSSISGIGGTFTLRNVTSMSTLSLQNLTQVKALDWQTLPQLQAVTFKSSGLSSADSISISDTFLSSLDAISVTSVGDMQIDNNHQLTDWTSSLESLTGQLTVQANGFNFQMDFPKLEWIANMAISNVSSISFPVLEAVNGSMRFVSNFFKSVNAPNMTSTGSDLAFNDNAQLTNISFPSLTTVNGGFTILNNTALTQIDGFAKLNKIGGAVLVGGNFTSVALPAISDVVGAFDVTSTSDISSSCSTFSSLKSSGKIQGKETCTSNNANANSGNGTSSGSSSTSSTHNAASPMALSMPLVLGFAALGGMAQALM